LKLEAETTKTRCETLIDEKEGGKQQAATNRCDAGEQRIVETYVIAKLEASLETKDQQ
jgi:hypothetical protein